VTVLGANPLISVTPGLMIWTIVCFFITFFVLKRYAFGPIQKMLDDRREQIRRSIEEAENAREEARRLLEEHRALMNQARSEAEQILAEARRTAQAMELRMREETEQERQRRLEETRREIAAETARALEQIRSEVADLTLEATAIVIGKKLDTDRDRELITEAIGSLDFSRLEDSR
jgi:F-type H+-transporting ATPase subunit b